jgi:hypothetical protein
VLVPSINCCCCCWFAREHANIGSSLSNPKDSGNHTWLDWAANKLVGSG